MEEDAGTSMLLLDVDISVSSVCVVSLVVSVGSDAVTSNG